MIVSSVGGRGLSLIHASVVRRLSGMTEPASTSRVLWKRGRRDTQVRPKSLGIFLHICSSVAPSNQSSSSIVGGFGRMGNVGVWDSYLGEGALREHTDESVSINTEN